MRKSSGVNKDDGATKADVRCIIEPREVDLAELCDYMSSKLNIVHDILDSFFIRQQRVATLGAKSEAELLEFLEALVGGKAIKIKIDNAVRPSGTFLIAEPLLNSGCRK